MQFHPLDRQLTPHKSVSNESVRLRKTRNPTGADVIDRIDILIGSCEREIFLFPAGKHVIIDSINNYYTAVRDILVTIRVKWILAHCPSALAGIELPAPSAIDGFSRAGPQRLTGQAVPDSQSQVDSSWRRLAEELDDARATSNALTHMAAKKKTLLLDTAIPLPSLATIQAWISICLTGWSHDKVWFITPHLPCTAEHRGRAGITSTQDTHADHSLSIKSKAHARDDDGRLLHGIALCFEANKHGVTSMQQLVDSGNAVGSISMLNFAIAHEPEYLTAPLPDPYGITAARAEWIWQVDSQRQIDHGLRALAKWYNVYLRFDNELASRRWVKAFANAFFEYTSLTHFERQKVQFDWALRLTQKPLKVVVGKRAKKVLIDMPTL